MGRLSRLAKKEFDCLIIGGGINGTGLARDLVLRGLSVALVEKEDFGAGTSGASSGMIHGGLRYINFDIGTTKLSCKDSGFVQKIAPHLIHRIPIVMPIKKKEYPPVLFIDTFFSVYDRYAPLKFGKPHVYLTAREALILEPGLHADLKGAIVFDEWGIDAHRLCLENALDAAYHGGTVINYAGAVELLWDGTAAKGPFERPGRICGAKVKDFITGEVIETQAKYTVNLAGPWVGEVAGLSNVVVPIRGGKGIHLVLDRKLTEVGILARTVDGRSVFLIPHGNVSLIGTTDDDFYGDASALDVTHDEIFYLLEAVSRVFPPIEHAKIIRSFAGVRPTLFEWGKLEDELPREHKIFDHEVLDGVGGFISMAGGKLATYRIMAEELADLICRKLCVETPCQTHAIPLPGGGEVESVEEVARQFQIAPYLAAGLMKRYGARVYQILEMTRMEPSTRRIICKFEPVLEAELRFSIRKEWARTPFDLARRTHALLGACQGKDCLYGVCQILGDELGLSGREVLELFQAAKEELWHWRYPVLSDYQLASESVLRWS